LLLTYDNPEWNSGPTYYGRRVIEVPFHCLTRYLVRARFGETDLMGIVHHATYLLWFEAGRVEYLHRRGVEYSHWAAQGLHLPVIEANVRYRRSIHFDDVVVVETRLAELTRVKLRFAYRLLRSDATEELMAEGSTLLVSVDASHVPKRLPHSAVELLTAPETHPRPIDQV
jgi:acyl-CoA thioester hydrolase